METKYRTFKYNNANSHLLDEFETLDKAIESAKALHNPDCPCWQGIYVVDNNGKPVWDSQK